MRERAWRARAAALRAAAALERRRRFALAGIVALQWGGALAVALLAQHNGWVYYDAGDGSWYWTSAWSLGHFRLPYAAVGYGLPTVLSPLGALLGPSILTGLPAIVLLNTLVLLPLVPLLLCGVAERIAGRLFGLLTAALWLVLPPLAYLLFAPDSRWTMLHIFLPGAVGLNALGDFPSLVACLTAAWLTLRALDEGSLLDALGAGTLAGFAVAIKPANLIFLPAPAVALLLARRFRALPVYALAVVPAVVALTVWKHRGLGYLPALTTPENASVLTPAPGGGPAAQAVGEVAATASNAASKYAHVSWTALRGQLNDLGDVFRATPLLFWCAIGGSLGVLARGFAKGSLVVLWFWAYFLVKGSASFSGIGSLSLFRLTEPAYPAFVLLAAASAVLVLPWAGSGTTARPVARRLGPRTAAAGLLLLGILPLLLVATARPRSRTSEFRLAGDDVPVVDVGARARADGPRVLLSWHAQRFAAGAVGYRLVRANAFTGSCGDAVATPLGCEGTQLVFTQTSSTSVVDRPGRGAWVYRVIVTASPNASISNGTPILASRPVAVAVS
ncbi:MAG TPA: hypothetical protein VIU86_18190 [Gaiellaceae bacterium]